MSPSDFDFIKTTFKINVNAGITACKTALLNLPVMKYDEWNALNRKYNDALAFLEDPETDKLSEDDFLSANGFYLGEIEKAAEKLK